MFDYSIEDWRAIERVNGHYEVSNVGRVRRAIGGHTTYTGRMLNSGLSSRGYPTVTLCRDGKKMYVTIHTLVAETFLGPRPSPAHQVNHIDGVKTNNRVGNLEWTTPLGNTRHAFRNGFTDRRGEGNGRAKLTARQVRAIRLLSREFSHRAIAEVVGVSATVIGDIRRGSGWKHVV